MIPEGGAPGGGTESHPPREFPRGNMMGGEELPRGVPPRGLGIQIGRIMLPPIEMFQIAFIGLYMALSIMISKKKINSIQV